jgi:hypothetical protein
MKTVDRNIDKRTHLAESSAKPGSLDRKHDRALEE